MSILCDNRQTIELLTSNLLCFLTRLRYIDIYYYWLRQEVQENRVKIEWISTTKISADSLTKFLSRQQYQKFTKILGLVDIESVLGGYIN